jgi:hypothetical protein
MVTTAGRIPAVTAKGVTMTMNWGPGFDAEVGYRRERVSADFGRIRRATRHDRRRGRGGSPAERSTYPLIGRPAW